MAEAIFMLLDTQTGGKPGRVPMSEKLAGQLAFFGLLSGTGTLKQKTIGFTKGNIMMYDCPLYLQYTLTTQYTYLHRMK